MKAVVLQGDTEFLGIVYSRIYDTIPVHFLSMGYNSIKWVVKSKKAYNLESGELEQIYFLSLNQIDNYNNTMGGGGGGVDIADQLIGTY